MSGNVLWSYFVRGRQCPITSRRMCFCIINLAFVKYFGHNFNCSQMAIWPVWTCWLKNFQLFCCPPILKLPTSGNIFVALFMRPFYLFFIFFYLFIRPGSTRLSSAGPSRWLCPSRHLERSNPMERSDRKIQLSFPLSREMVKSPAGGRKETLTRTEFDRSFIFSYMTWFQYNPSIYSGGGMKKWNEHILVHIYHI